LGLGAAGDYRLDLRDSHRLILWCSNPSASGLAPVVLVNPCAISYVVYAKQTTRPKVTNGSLPLVRFVMDLLEEFPFVVPEAVLGKIFFFLGGGAGPSSFGRQQRLSKITIK